MSLLPRIYTVESVTKGHPDRVCDQIADRILHEITSRDPGARVAVEVFGCKGVVTIGGEVTTSTSVDYEALAREVLQSVGYDPVEFRLHMNQQSPQIGAAVSDGGAGDQGIMYGYATADTASHLPLGVDLAHGLTDRLETLRESGEVPWLKSDGKSQVTIRDGAPEVIVVSTQHDEGVSLQEVRSAVLEKVISPLTKGGLRGVAIHINPAGAWSIGGFHADSGLTGRKLAVDGYGGILPGGGGSTHGKDNSKVDRSATHKAREVAVDLVSRGLARECLISVAYAIGVNEPVMLYAINEERQDVTRLLDSEQFRASNLR
ncbi:MAG: S-adenosylmethionine synthase [Candidatus Uhrbacteria bacterium GW2011_GWA2_52_8d]|uniref:methionine adenosyltransferase n=1 Tax=Candidatus Uhrbacteria bacterium GW2011_GWA2_52_8d TaxID=1618979 RepID=A0A0G1XLD0_9BACT|nr:MAG: S-adenosylmethionine synthase [Candidatus Uhrbacteria bacterium GW2011_GWA2_52_8d]